MLGDSTERYIIKISRHVIFVFPVQGRLIVTLFCEDIRRTIGLRASLFELVHGVENFVEEGHDLV